MTLPPAARGFTLIELLAAMLVLSLMALTAYRGLGAVLDARAHVAGESAHWQRVARLIERVEQDLRLAAPRSMRTAAGIQPPWIGRPEGTPGPRLEFSRFAASEDAGSADRPRRVAYGLNERQEVELWQWPGADEAPGEVPARYPMLGGVAKLDIQYLNAKLDWVDAWPGAAGNDALPRAVRLRVVFAAGTDIVRIFALNT